MRKQRYPSAKDRLLNNILKVGSECWEWQGSLQGRGYGTIRGNDKRQWTAHRLSYSLFKGIILKNQLVCHTCDNPKCVNPDHLFLGTQSDNMKDCFKKGRSKNIFIKDKSSVRKGKTLKTN